MLQQVGTPLEVYNNPANVFVARFIGSPGMNLVPATLSERDGRSGRSRRGGRVAPLDAGWPRRRGAGAREVWFGFRPEGVNLAADGDGLQVTITFLERIGSRTIVHFDAGGTDGKAVFENDVPLAAGTVAQLVPADALVRLFDRQSGLAIGGA